MDQLKKIAKYILSKFSKVQLLIIVIILICCFIISDSNIFARFGYNREISNLKREIKYYRNKSVEDKGKLHELKSNKENIEKFARENYRMKKENEDIFIVE